MGVDRVVILNDLSDGYGGASYLAVLLATRLAEQGVAVTFVAGDGGNPALPAAIDQLALGGRALLEGGAGSALRGLYDREMARRLARWIAVHDTPGTVYHLHNWSLIFSPSVFDALKPVARRCILHAHDFFLACPNGAFIDYPRRSVCHRVPLSVDCLTTQCDKRSYSHKLWRSARQGILFRRLRPFLEEGHLVTIYAPMRPWLERALAPRSISAIGNPVQAFGPQAEAPELQRRILHIGGVQQLKGVHDLAEAGRRLGIAVDFYGEGEALAELKQRYPEHAYHGWRSRSEIAQALGTARACVVATQSPEPFCLSAFETLATGVPLVVSDAILACEALVASGGAIDFPAADIDALTGRIAQVLGDDHLVARLAGAARERGPGLSNSADEWVAAHRELYAARLGRVP